MSEQAVGIPIGKHEFREMVARYLGKMTDNDELTAEDGVTLIRLWNTIELSHLDQDDELYRDYRSTFFPGFVERVSGLLDLLPTKGMALYSKEHDIYLGGQPHARSQHVLKD